MKQQKYFLILFLFLLSLPSMASHIVGAYISYERVSGNNYTVTLEIYQDCSGIPSPTTLNVLATSTCGAGSINVPVSLGNNVDITPVCAGVTTSCNGGGGAIGITKSTYTGTFSAPANACNKWVLTFDDCCRNASIVSGGASQIFQVSSDTLNNTSAFSNDSPEFLNDPVVYICANQNISFSQSAYDADGDVLAYSLTNASAGGVSLTYGLGYSPTSPLGPNWNVAINSNTGQLSFTSTGPSTIGAFVVCVKVESYRNGVLLGSTTRDMMVNVVSCGVNTVNCCHSDFSYTNTGNTYNFNAIVFGGATGTTYSWDFFDGTTSSLANPVKTFNFNGSNVVSLTTTTNGCSHTTFYNLGLIGGVPALTCNMTAMPINSNTYTFTVNATGGTPPYVYNWNAGGGVIISQQSNTATIQFPPGATYNVCATVTDANGMTSSACNSVSILPSNCNAAFTMSSNSGPAPLNVQFTSTSTNAMSYQWDFGDGTSSTVANPAHIYTTNGTYTACLSISDGMGCTDSACQMIYVSGVTATIAYNQVNPNTFIFTGTATGGTAPYTYYWDAPGATPQNSISNPSTFLFNAPGVYNVCLVVTDANGVTATQCQAVTVSPTTCQASIFANPSSGTSAPLTVNFTYGFSPITATPVTFQWDFGDGTSSTVANPTKIYTNTGIYQACVIITDLTGCSDTACMSINVGTGIDLDGYVYTNSTLADSFVVYLIEYSNVSGGTLTAIDSQKVYGAPAYYNFTNITPNIYYTKAAILPNSANYSGFVPTYHLSELFWSNADPINFLAVPPTAPSGDINLIAGVNPGGPGFIGGLLSQGANRIMAGAGAGREILLLDMNDNPVAYTYTDVNSTFSFPNLAFGTYKVYPEVLNKLTIPAIITLTSTSPADLEVNMIISHDSIYVDNTVAIENPTEGAHQIGQIIPNPTSDKANLSISLAKDMNVSFVLTNLTGQVIQTSTARCEKGLSTHTVDLSEVSAGMYFLTISSKEGLYVTRKIVKE